MVYAEKGNQEQAIADFSQTIRLRPEDMPAYFERGKIYLQQNPWDLAVADFDQLILKKSFTNCLN
jgi:tetratricopeptide (TPR) repeat protein